MFFSCDIKKKALKQNTNTEKNCSQ